jgi:hypothetical protein
LVTRALLEKGKEGVQLKGWTVAVKKGMPMLVVVVPGSSGG